MKIYDVNWKKNLCGETAFYAKNLNNKKIPGKLITKIYPKFNRAIIFDTSKTSWHAVAPIKINKIRKSIAVYYLVNLKKSKISKRKKALYAPSKYQINNKKVLKFIKLRSDPNLFACFCVVFVVESYPSALKKNPPPTSK